VTCAAFGSPPPRVWFSSSALEISDFSQVDSTAVNVFSREEDLGDNVFTYSTLDICTREEDFDTFATYLTEIYCHTENGVDSMSNIGIQSIEFRPRPFSKCYLLCVAV